MFSTKRNSPAKQNRGKREGLLLLEPTILVTHHFQIPDMSHESRETTRVIFVNCSVRRLSHAAMRLRLLLAPIPCMIPCRVKCTRRYTGQLAQTLVGSVGLLSYVCISTACPATEGADPQQPTKKRLTPTKKILVLVVLEYTAHRTQTVPTIIILFNTWYLRYLVNIIVHPISSISLCASTFRQNAKYVYTGSPFGHVGRDLSSIVLLYDTEPKNKRQTSLHRSSTQQTQPHPVGGTTRTAVPVL